MINPEKITNYNYSDHELEELWIFSICVAGKPAGRTAKAVHSLLYDDPQYHGSPFDVISALIAKRALHRKLKKYGVGQYNRIKRSLRESVEHFGDGRLRSATVNELESIHGVGPKTARFFVLHTRRNQRYAALDTHILKFLKEKGYDAPRSTPTGRRYRELEQAFLKEAALVGKSPATFDLELWKQYSGHA